ncbi:hypothetical protein BD779DRAFT_323283 [Infundibulicybe gibba]|nr:hypothetical protein BD779DRAFT_323283 [Infundibulicybe gibba]
MSSQVLFTFSERLGIFITVESATLSAVSTSALLGYIGYRAIKKSRLRRRLRKLATQIIIAANASDATDSSLFVNLMIAELVQAIGGMLNIKWMVDAVVTEGSHCTTQGVLKQAGDVGVALTSLAIASQTFGVLVLRLRAPAFTSKVVIGLIWTFVALIIGISSAVHKGGFYGNTDYWCWIREEFTTERIVLEYLWLWLAAGIMLVLYGIIAAVIRGFITIEDGQVQIGRQEAALEANEEEQEEEKQAKDVANLMLFYPAIYIICVFPIGLVRWLKFGGHYVPPAATIFGSVMFSLSGIFNVILYKITRPDWVSAPSPTPSELFEMQSNPQSPARTQPLRPNHNLGALPNTEAKRLADNIRNGHLAEPSHDEQTLSPSSLGSRKLSDMHSAHSPVTGTSDHEHWESADTGRLPGGPPDDGRLPDSGSGSGWKSSGKKS